MEILPPGAAGRKLLVFREAKVEEREESALLDLKPLKRADAYEHLVPLAPTHGGASLERLARGQLRQKREQLLRYEIDANNGVFGKPPQARAPGEAAALERREDLHAAHPLSFAEIPLGGKDEVNFFHAQGNASSEALVGQMIRSRKDPVTQEEGRFAYLPIHWEEVGTFRDKFPHLKIIQDGEVRRGSSARSLFIGTEEHQIPARFDLETTSLKLHLSRQNYDRMGGLGGNRDINGNDALMATVIDHVLHQVGPQLSPYLEIQPEATAQVARLHGRNGPEEIGAVYRTVDDPQFIPGFSLFSPTLERLPHVPAGAIAGRDLEEGTGPERILARDAIRFAREKALARGENWSRVETFKKLFAEPLLDVYFSLAKQGFAMELHSQNFGFKFNPETGLVDKVVLRDLHGMGYSHSYRAQKGEPDLFSPERLREAFPEITQADLDGFFKRDGQLRSRYEQPHIFQTTLDFFLGQFFYNTLVSLKADKTFDAKKVNEAIEAIKDTVEQKAREHGFDLRSLPQPSGYQTDFESATRTGIASKILFRRAQPR